MRAGAPRLVVIAGSYGNPDGRKSCWPIRPRTNASGSEIQSHWMGRAESGAGGTTPPAGQSAARYPARTPHVVPYQFNLVSSFCFRFSYSERPASFFRRRAAMIRSWREKRRPDGPLSSPHGVAMAELTQQHRHTTPARKVRFDCRPSPRFLRPRGGLPRIRALEA